MERHYHVGKKYENLHKLKFKNFHETFTDRRLPASNFGHGRAPRGQVLTESRNMGEGV